MTYRKVFLNATDLLGSKEKINANWHIRPFKASGSFAVS